MLIQIRGTSGSGKSTIIREIMKLYPKKVPVYLPDEWRTVYPEIFFKKRKQPLYYILTGSGLKDLVVLGHYETACGGCDTLSTYDQLEFLIDKLHSEYTILFEGLLVSGDKKLTLQYTDGRCGGYKIFHLNTDLDTCIKSVEARRQEKASTISKPLMPLNPRNTSAKWYNIASQLEKFPPGFVFPVSREECLQQIKELLTIGTHDSN